MRAGALRLSEQLEDVDVERPEVLDDLLAGRKGRYRVDDMHGRQYG